MIICVALSACNDYTTSSNVHSDVEGTLVYGRAAHSISLDPIRQIDGESLKVARNIYETLVQFGEDNTEIVPSLAKSWEVSEDGLVYTFLLNRGIEFHDGTALNALAVVKNFERWMNGPAAEFPYYGEMFGGFLDDEAHIIERVTAKSTHTVEIRLKKPFAPLLNNLAMVAFSMASPASFELDAEALQREPVGTGPFKLKAWQDETIYLEKNEAYWKKGLPKVSQVIYKTIPDSAERLASLVAGEIDIADGLSLREEKQLLSEPNIELVKRPSLNVGFLGMTLTQGPLEDARIREAISYAIDRKSIVESAFLGYGMIAKNPLQSSALGYNQQVEPYIYDPEKAKELLDQSSYNGKEIELWTMPISRPYMPNSADVAKVIEKNLTAIGMNIKLVTHEWPVYLEKTSNGEAQLFILGGTSDNGDPDNLLSLFFDRHGLLNKTRLDDEDIQGWLKEARETMDKERRIELYAQIQQRLREVIPLVPLVHATPILGVAEEVQNYRPHPTGFDSLAEVTIK